MGIFARFEKAVEGAVSGAFARAFKGDVQPVEIAARLQRELDAEAKLMSRDKRLVPNDFRVGLSAHDHGKLDPYASTLTQELATELHRHATEMGYVFNGPVTIAFDLNASLPTGRFTVESAAVAGVVERPAAAPTPPAPGSSRPAGPAPGSSRPAPPAPGPARPVSTGPGSAGAGSPYPPAPSADPGLGRGTALVLEVNGSRHELRAPGMTIGRGTDADLRINDPGISRLHAEIRVGGAGQQIDIVDLGSTNGIVVNGQRVRHALLQEGSRIEIGSTRMLLHAPAGR